MATETPLDISLDFDTSDAEHTLSDFARKIIKTFDKMNFDPLSTVQKDIETATNNIEELQTKIKNLKGQKVPIQLDIDKDAIKSQKGYIKELEAEIAQAEKKLSGMAPGRMYEKSKADLERLRQDLIVYKDELKELQSPQYRYVNAEDTAEFKQLNVQLEEQTHALEALKDYYNQIAAPVEKTTEDLEDQSDTIEMITTKVKTYDSQIEQIENKMAAINEKLAQGGLGDEEIDELAADYEKLNNQLIALKERQRDTAASSNILRKAFVSLSYSVRNLLSKAVTKFGTVLGGLTRLLKGTRTNLVSKVFSANGLDLGKILKYAIGIRSLYTLFNKLRSAAKDGFGYVAKYSPAVQASLTKMNAALTQMKAAVGVAVTPLVQVLAPAIVRIAGLFTLAANAVARFFAVLTGRKTVIQATNNQVAFNSAVKGSGKAAKDAAKDIKQSLAAFDDLDVLVQDTNDDLEDLGGSGSDGYDLSSAFEEVEVFSELADMIKDAWQSGDVLKAFEDVGKYIGEKLKAALDYALENVFPQLQKFATRFADAVAGTINGFVKVSGLAESIGSTIAEAINTGLAYLSRFWGAVNWNNVGAFLYNGISQVIADINWEALGNYLVNKLNGLITLAWAAVGNGEWITGAIARASEIFYRILTEVDWARLAETIYVAIRSLLDGAINFIEENRESMISAIQTFLENLHIDELILMLLQLVGEAFITLFKLAINMLKESTTLSTLLLLAIGIIIASAITGIPVLGMALGAALMAAIGLGVTQGQDVVKSSLDNVLNYVVTDSMGNIWVIGSDMGATLMKGTSEGISSNGQLVYNAHNHSWDIITADGQSYSANYESLISGSGDTLLSIVSEKTGLAESTILEMLGIVQETTETTNQAINQNTDEHLSEINSNASQKLSELESTYDEAYSTMEQTVDDSNTNIEDTSLESLEKLQEELESHLDDMKTDVSDSMDNVKTTVTDSNNSVIKSFQALTLAVGVCVSNFVTYMQKMATAVANAASAIASTPITPVVNTSSIDAGIAKLNEFLSLMAQAGAASASVPSAGSMSVSVPHLASGGVLPPNQPFLAMLGDQKKGTNIEAPLDTITAAMMDALRSSNYSNGGTNEIVLNIDGTELARILLPYDLNELNRQGYNVSVLEGR